MKKKKYEAPQTRYLEVELEQGFMVQGSIVGPEDPGNNGVVSNSQEVLEGGADGENWNFGSESWE